MRRRVATVAVTLTLALGAPAAGVVATTTVACAATEQRAALVVDTGAVARSYCVALGADTVSGTELIRLAHEQYGLDYRLGFGGRAVCRLAGVGVDGGDCFGAYPDFWGYWHGDGDGGWNWAGASAADWTVGSGDVEGWQWGPGQDGATHAAPPSTRHEAVCAPAEPSPEPQPQPQPGGGGPHQDGDGGERASPGDASGGEPRTEDPSASPPGARDRPAERREPREPGNDATSGSGAAASASPTGAPPVTLAAGDAPSNDPAGGMAGTIAAAAAVAALGIAGALVVRRRRAG